MGKVKHSKTKNPGNWLTRKKGCCSQWRVVSMQATSPFSDTRISSFQNISTSLPLHQSYSSKKPMALTAPAEIPRQGACNITKALETLKFSSWPGSMEWSHGQSFWDAFPVTQRLPQVDALQKWIRCGRTCLDSNIGFPIEKRWFLVVRRIWVFFLQIEIVFQQLNWIPSSHPDSVSIHFPMSCPLPSVCLKSSYPSSPEWVQDQPPSKLPHPALPNLRIPGSHPGFLNHFL